MRLAVVGDLHGAWDETDRLWFDRSDYDRIVFVGDLGGRFGGGLRIARDLARLEKPATLVPGNHDALNLVQLAGEIWGLPALIRAGAIGHRARAERLRNALGPVRMAAYDWHEIGGGGDPVALVGPDGETRIATTEP